MPASPQPENDALAARLAALSPERRAVVERLLRERGTVPCGARDGLRARVAEPFLRLPIFAPQREHGFNAG